MTSGKKGGAETAHNGARPRILVVDDDDTLCEALREHLNQAGFAVATVPHGAAALELVQQHEPAVILLDLRMPIMDGWSFVEQYRRVARPPASIVLISCVRDLRTVAARLGCDGYLEKPFELDSLTRVVATALARS